MLLVAGIQLLGGLLNVLLLAPVWMQIVHLLVADLLWIAFVLLGAHVLRRNRPSLAVRRLAIVVASATRGAFDGYSGGTCLPRPPYPTTVHIMTAPLFRVLRQPALTALLVAFFHVCAFAQGTALPPAGPAAAPPASAPSVVAPTAEIVSRAEAYLQAQARVNLFNGTVLVARDGAPILVKGYGMADAEWQVPNTAQTKFRLGSITKQFTATVVLRLQEQKKLSVQDAIART